MRKLRIGDTVRILPREEGQNKQLPSYVDEMLEYEGNVSKIKSFDSQYDFIVKLEETHNMLFDWNWHTDWLEYVEPDHFEGEDLFKI